VLLLLRRHAGRAPSMTAEARAVYEERLRRFVRVCAAGRELQGAENAAAGAARAYDWAATVTPSALSEQ
jgi:hypothetical protein